MINRSHDAGLVGRDDEGQALQDALDNARSGRGSLVLVSGEAGIGKSALVEDLKQMASEQDFCVLWGGSYDLTTTPPYAPWLEALGRYRPVQDGPELPPWVEDSARLEQLGGRPELFKGTQQFFSDLARNRALLIVLEDMHWSDQGSLDMLRHLSRNVEDIPALLVATYRDDEVTASLALAKMLPALVRESSPLRLELSTLSADALRELLAPLQLSTPEQERLLRHLHSRSQGNPLFAHELLRWLELEGTLRIEGSQSELGLLDATRVPPLVTQVVNRRLDRLSAETKQLLEIAAVIGHDVDIEVWSQVSGCPVTALDEPVGQAIKHHVLAEVPDAASLRFSHALVREALYQGIVVTKRRARHLAIGELLSATPNADPDAVADHLLRAGDDRALEWLLRAGLRAWMAAAWHAAADRFLQAADLMAGDEARMNERGWILMTAGSLLRYEDNQRSAELLQKAVQIGAKTGDRLLEADSIRRLGGAHCHEGQIGRGLAEFRSGIAIIESVERSRHSTGDVRRIENIIREIIAGEPVPDQAVTRPHEFEGVDLKLVMAQGILVHWLAQSGHFSEALELGAVWTRDDEVRSQAGHRYAEWRSSGDHGLALSHQIFGKHREAEALWRRASAQAALGGDFVVEASALGQLMLGVLLPYYADQPARIARNLDEIRQASQRGELQLDGPPFAAYCDFYADLLAGDWDNACAFEKQVVASSMPVAVNMVTPGFGMLARYQGRKQDAWKRVHELLPEGPGTPPGQSYFVSSFAGQLLATNLALDDGDLVTARAWLEAHDRWLEWSGAVIGRAEGELGWARYYLHSDRLDDAHRRAREALQQASEPRQPLALLAAHRALGVIGTRQGQFDTARNHVERALSLAEACAAPYERALTLLALAEIEAHQKRPDMATAPLSEARKTLTTIGARPALAQANEIEARLGSLSVEYPAGLTSREAQVLSLIATGHSNREMADELYLSIRTVERHVSNIYRKIDAHNRTDATRYALQHGIAELANT